MAPPPAAAPWTPRRLPALAWSSTPTSPATASGGSPSCTALTATMTCPPNPCRATPPSPLNCEYGPRAQMSSVPSRALQPDNSWKRFKLWDNSWEVSHSEYSAWRDHLSIVVCFTITMMSSDIAPTSPCLHDSKHPCEIMRSKGRCGRNGATASSNSKESPPIRN